MITRIREVRRARGMTLDDVAQACNPPTTPQTIGRLETGTRTVSVGWLNRIADALGVDAADLVEAAATRRNCPSSPSSAPTAPSRPSGPPWLSRRDQGGSGRHYGLGQQRRLSRRRRNLVRHGRARGLRPGAQPRRAGAAPRRPLPVRPADRPRRGAAPASSPGAGGRQQIVTNPPWIAVATKLVRSL